MSKKIYSQYNMIVGSNTDWAELNPILDDGQPAKEYELKNGAQTNIKFKIGDGVTPWRTLPYVGGGSSGDVNERLDEVEANTKYSGYYIVFSSSNGTILSDDNKQTIITPKVYKQDIEIPYATFSYLWEKDNVSFSTNRLITVKDKDITDTSLFLLKIYDADTKIVATSTIYVSLQESIVSLNGVLTPNRASTQTYSEADGFEPNFTSSPFKLTATVVDGQSDVSASCTYTWKYRLYGDTNYTTSPTTGKEFTLNQNLMSREKPSIDILSEALYKGRIISFTEKISLFIKDNFSFAATLSNEHAVVRTDVNGQNPYSGSMDKAKTVVYAYKGTTLLTAVPSKTALSKGTFFCESDTNLSKLSVDTFKLTQAAVAADVEENSSIIKVYIESETNVFDRIFFWSKQRDAVNGEKGEPGNTGATGQGVESITELYYKSTSKTAIPADNLFEPFNVSKHTWTSGAYIWTCSKIIYKNPASTVYIGKSCDTSWEAVNEIEVDTLYYLSISSTALIGGSWLTEAPEWEDGKYMWSKTVTKDGSGAVISESPASCIAGASAKALDIRGGNVFAYNKTGGVTPETITLTAEFQNASGAVTWQYKNIAGTFVNTGITGTSYTVLPTSDWFIGDQLTLKAYLTSTVYDIVTITKIRDGLSPILLNLEFPQGNVIKESDVEIDSLTIKPSVTQAKNTLSGYTYSFFKRSIGDTEYIPFKEGSVVNGILTVQKTDVIATLYIKCTATKGEEVLEAFTTVFDLSDPYQCVLSSDIGGILKTDKDTAVINATIFQNKTVISNSLFQFQWFINQTLQADTLDSLAVSGSSFAGDSGVISCNILKGGSVVASAEYSISKVYLEDLETKITEKYTAEIEKLDGSIGVIVSSITEVSNNITNAKQDIDTVSKNLDAYQEANDNNVENIKNQVDTLPTKEDVETTVTSKITNIDILPEGVLLEILSRTETVVNNNSQIQSMGQRFQYTAEGFSISDAGVKGWHQNFHNGDEQIRFSADGGMAFLVSSQINPVTKAPLLVKFRREANKNFTDPEPEQRYVEAKVIFNNETQSEFICPFIPSVRVLNDVNKKSINVSVDGGATYSADILNFSTADATAENVKFSADKATWHDTFEQGDKYYALFLTDSRMTESASLVKNLDYNLNAFKVRFKGPSGIYHYSMQSTDTVFSASVDNGQTFGADTALPAGIISTIGFKFETIDSALNVSFTADGVNYFGPFVAASKDSVLYEFSGSTENSLFSLLLTNTGANIQRKDGLTDENGKEISFVVGKFDKDGLDTPKITTKEAAVSGSVLAGKVLVEDAAHFRRLGSDKGVYVLSQNSNGHFGLKYMQ